MSLPAPAIASGIPASKRHGRTATVITALVLTAVLVWHINATIASPVDRWTLPDLQVYRAAVEAALAGQPVYTTGFTTSNLPWLYPPFALIALTPLAWLPADAAKVTISLLSIAALTYCCHASWRATATDRTWHLPLTLATTAVLLVSEPMQGNLIMGQINVLVTALVLTDVLLPTGHRLKGLWVGLATGSKLTPALVAVYYMLRRDWAAARRAAMTFTATALLGAVCFPGQSWTYWTQAVFATRIGPAHLGNQSLLGVMLRVGALSGVDEGAVRAGWLLLAAALSLSAILILARLNPNPLGTYCGLTAITLLVSPLSWTPHWIALAAPTTIWIASRQPRTGRVVGTLVLAGLVLFVWPVDGVWSGMIWLVYPANYWPHTPPLARTVGWVGLGSLYSILGAAALATILTSSFAERLRTSAVKRRRVPTRRFLGRALPLPAQHHATNSVERDNDRERVTCPEQLVEAHPWFPSKGPIEAINGPPRITSAAPRRLLNTSPTNIAAACSRPADSDPTRPWSCRAPGPHYCLRMRSVAGSD